MARAFPPRIVANQLYDFVVCDHRIALDVALPRDQRSEPDEAATLLFEKGLIHEREITKSLGYVEIEAEDGDWEAASRRTLDAMRSGARGIAQGVLLDGRNLARPDLLERHDGPSRLGPWHYVPGDIKSALSTRSDAALQIGFAAKLLEPVQGLRPDLGFVILGDGSRENLDLGAIVRTVDDAASQVAAIADGRAETRPFHSRDCARCRWRDRCLDELTASRDPSFVYGMTRARRRAYARAGLHTLDDLAGATEESLRSAGAPTEGLSRLRAQARALLESRAVDRRTVDPPRGRRLEHFLRIESNPLENSEPFALAWGSGPPGGPLERVEAKVVTSDRERAASFLRLVDDLESGSGTGDPIYAYGPATDRALARLGTASGLAPGRLGELQGRLVDLAPWVRRAAALPVVHYRFDEVSAFLRGRSLPGPRAAEDARFVAYASGAPERLAKLVEESLDDLESLRAVRDWLVEERAP